MVICKGEACVAGGAFDDKLPQPVRNKTSIKTPENLNVFSGIVAEITPVA